MLPVSISKHVITRFVQFFEVLPEVSNAVEWISFKEAYRQISSPSV